ASASLRIDGTRFVDESGRPFAWRGITAFRLLELVASGREKDADRYLAWCAARNLTIVRVLAMAKHAFPLPPAKGAAALPKLLALAGKRHIVVEAVALADTASYTFDVERHVGAIGAACGAAGSCVIRLANEPP